MVFLLPSMFNALSKRAAGDDVNAIVYDNIQPTVWGITVPCAIICLLSCVLRLYARAVVAKEYGIDDWLMVAVTITWIGQQYIAWMWTALGGGLHMDEVSAENLYQIQVYLFAEEFYYLFLELLIKMSFLFFYLRTIGVSDGVRRAIYVVMGLACCQVAGTWIFYGFQCIPIGAYFHPENYPNAKCVSAAITYYVPTAVNVAVNLVVYILPIYPVWGLQTSIKRRIKLISMFTLGFAAITVSLCRFVMLWQLSNTKDTSYIFGSVTLVTSIEFDVAIVTANAPGIAMFWKSIVRRRPLGTTNISGGGDLEPSSGGVGGGKEDKYCLGNLSQVGGGGGGGGTGTGKSARRSTRKSGPAWIDTRGSEEELRPVIGGGTSLENKKDASSDGDVSEGECSLRGMKVDRRVIVRSERVAEDGAVHQRSVMSPREYYEFGPK
ncbi:hypothetical protein KC330_g1092 [Hortaea werneckii]|nr:hypothetical protein KC330_g1092 [Hortaea werneckii]